MRGLSACARSSFRRLNAFSAFVSHLNGTFSRVNFINGLAFVGGQSCVLRSMGVAAAAALHKGMRVPVSSHFIRSKYLCSLMENMYTKVNDVCMYECIHAY